jgi:hypothetical protein
MRPEKIILHHSSTKDSGTVSWNAIRRYHVNVLGWTDIGYHFGIEFVADPGDPKGSFEILTGRTLDKAGAHTTGQNLLSIGICFVGNFDDAPPPAEQWKQGVRLVKWLCRHFGITQAKIFGHREVAAGRTCPGKMFDLDRFRIEVERHEKSLNR